MMDVTRNAVWTEDCCGKMDLDFPILDCDTRYWTDNTCKCHFRLCGGVYLYREREWHEPFDAIDLLASDYIEGNSKEECQMKARQWYNEHVVQALELAILKIKERPELKESEDERVRKAMIDFFKHEREEGITVLHYGVNIERMITWLEKQAKKDEEILVLKDQIESLHAAIKALKEAHKIELEKQGEQKPKFRVGDTIKCKYDDRQFTIKSVDLDKGTYTYTQEGSGNDIDYADEEFELVEQKPTDKVEQKGMNIVEEDMTPFQKEVFCIIDTAIEEEQGLKQVCDELLRLAHDDIMQKPAWSEEDEEEFQIAIDTLVEAGQHDSANWLKSLKERYTWKPSNR